MCEKRSKNLFILLKKNNNEKIVWYLYVHTDTKIFMRISSDIRGRNNDDDDDRDDDDMHERRVGQPVE